MKKEVFLSMIATLLLSLVFLTTLFILVINYEYMESTQQNLFMNNNLIINVLKDDEIKDKEAFLIHNFKNQGIRVTLVDDKGNVNFDSLENIQDMGNHLGRKEVKDAMNKGQGYSIRRSDTDNVEYLYCATSYDNGKIVRSSIPTKSVSVFGSKYLKYYGFILMISFVVSLVFSSKLTYAFTKPINDLEFITSRIAKGELNRRVSVNSSDEIGQLARTFNNMADKLQETINDAVDKQNRLEAVLKSMDSGVIAVDKNMRVIIINPYAKKIFGIYRDIIGENLMDNIRDFEFQDILKNRNDDYNEMKIIWPKERDLRIRTADIINGRERIGTVAVVQDMTDVIKLENIRSQFVANVSHELKTPLTSIKGFAETLKYVDDSETRKKFLNIIDDEADRLTRLISDILTLSDIESKKQQKVERINVNEVITDVCCLISNSAKEKNINISTAGEKVPEITGDKDHFKQMMINLVDNAVKYTESGGMVTVGTELQDDNVAIWVQDTGVGISKEHLDRLFERFYRVDKARSRAAGGTGLGLAIVKHIVMNFNGKIEVESQVGKGSKFIVMLPQNVQE